METKRMPVEGSIKLDENIQWAESPDCMYLIDAARQRTIAINHPLWQNLGYKLHEVEIPDAAVPQQFLHEADRVVVDNFFGHLFSMKPTEEYRRHLRFLSKSGSWKTFCLRIAHYDRANNIFLGVITNITPEKGTYQRARRKIAALALANKKLDTLMLELCHDVRTPLQTIQLLAGRLDGDPDRNLRDIKSLVDSLKKTALQVNSMLNSILTRRINGGTSLANTDYTANVRTILSQVVMEAEVRMKEAKTEFIAEIAPDLPDTLHLPGPELYQILMNLIINALKHAREGTVLLACSWAPAASELRIFVKDSGPRLEGAKSQEQSFGLGLGICRRLLKDVGGQLNFTSSPENGTEVTVTVTAYDLDALDASDSQICIMASPPGSPARFKILALDGDPFNLSLLSMFARSLGGYCVTKDNIYDAISHQMISEENFDAIFIDKKLVEGEGSEAVRRLQSYDAKSRVYVMHDEDHTPIEQIRCDGWLHKPLSANKLRAVIEAA